MRAATSAGIPHRVRAALIGLSLLMAAPAARAAQTIVSLSFGGTLKNQLQTLPLLDQYGFKGTFFVASGALGNWGPKYMVPADVQSIAADGHEIGGLSVDDLPMGAMSVSSVTYEVCGVRQALIDLGINPISFDYPSGVADATIEGIVQSCGFISGRGSWKLGCNYSGCAAAESLPPADPYWIRTTQVVSSTTALGDIEQYVINAENAGGGWVPLAFKNVCDGCDQYAISPADFASLLSWLAARASSGTVVQNIGQVMSAFTPPNPVPAIAAVSPSSAAAGGAGFTLTVNGTNFISSSTVRWNGQALPTVFVSATQLSAAIPAGDLASATASTVTVFNPIPAGGASKPAAFPVYAPPPPPNPAPTLAAVSPSSATAGDPGFTLSVAGAGFIGGSTVLWNGQARATTFVSGTQLTAAIMAGDLASPTTAMVAVFSPGPGGGTSTAVGFPVHAAPPSLILPPPPSPGTPIGPAGGSVVLATQAGPISVAIPPGAFAQTVDVTLSVPTSYPAAQSHVADLSGTGVGVQITLDAPVQPVQDVTISLPFRDSDVTGVDRNLLVLARFDPGAGAWIPLGSSARVVGNTVVGQTRHFSLFEIMAFAPAATVDDVKIFPNPLRPAQGHTAMTFANLPAFTRLRVYTALGALVKDLSADATGTALWDGTNQSGRPAASGVYFVFAQGGGTHKTFKAAIQR